MSIKRNELRCTMIAKKRGAQISNEIKFQQEQSEWEKNGKKVQ